jgi:hypothetical protein
LIDFAIDAPRCCLVVDPIGMGFDDSWVIRSDEACGCVEESDI